MFCRPVKKSNPTLTEAANEAAGRIYGAGLSLYRGKVTFGGNNVMADRVAAEFDDADLRTLSKGNANERGFASIIAIRQHFAASGREELLQDIYDEAQRLKQTGWVPSLGEPGPAPYRS